GRRPSGRSRPVREPADLGPARGWRGQVGVAFGAQARSDLGSLRAGRRGRGGRGGTGAREAAAPPELGGRGRLHDRRLALRPGAAEAQLGSGDATTSASIYFAGG